MIRVEKLTKIYDDSEETVALDNVTIEFPEEKFVAIYGKSGSGKTTLLNMLGLLDKTTSGEILLFDRKASSLKYREVLDYRRNKIGVVFQFFKLIPVLTVKENIMLAVRKKKLFDKNYFREIIEMLDIERLLDKFPDELSGGQKQRVAIARAIINKPKLLLADEPTGNLDSHNSSMVMKLLLELAKRYGMTLIVVTHDKDIRNMADFTVELSDGRIARCGYNEQTDN